MFWKEIGEPSRDELAAAGTGSGVEGRGRCASAWLASSRALAKLHKAPCGVFGQRLQDDLFHGRRKIGVAFAQGSRSAVQVLAREFGNRPLKGLLATEPLVDESGQGVLIAGRRGLAANLLGRHVG